MIVLMTLQNIAQTITDKDGNIYTSVTIGAQIWLKENLMTTKYNDSTAIPLVTNSTAWDILTTPAYCNYNNTTNADTINTYGRLYNWYTVNTGNLCPAGWHVPDTTEWSALITYLGGDSVAGEHLKEVGTAHWLSPNTGADNSGGFTALPAGCRYGDNYGVFSDIGNYAGFWVATKSFADYAWYHDINYLKTNIYNGVSYDGNGFSVRCLKDMETGINENDYFRNFKIYPNPAGSLFTIEGATLQNAMLSINNMVGELVLQKRQLSNGKNEMDISNLSKGIYIIKVENTQGIKQQKLIKE